MLKNLIKKVFNSSPPEVAPEKRPALILEHKGPSLDIRPDPIDICFCGSGKFFKSCCGSRESKRHAPYGIFVFENYIDPEVCQELVAFAENQNASPLLVIDKEASTEDNIVKVKHKQRVSDRVHMENYQPGINQIVKSAFIDLTNKCLQKELDWVETPQVLRYTTGGTYQAHADSENMDIKTRMWKKIMDRDLSMLIYLNKEYKGGTLYFDKFNYRLQPKPGMVVLFPSDNRYMHAAEEVTAGVRYVIVSWASAKGTHKISSKPPEAYIPINYSLTKNP